MNHHATPAAPSHRTRASVLLGLAILGLAGVAFVVRRPLMMSAPTCLAGRGHGCFDTFNGVVLMTLVALPSAALVVWAPACRRRRAGRARVAPLVAHHGDSAVGPAAPGAGTGGLSRVSAAHTSSRTSAAWVLLRLRTCVY
ncbi:hypothetical protein [Streptomyces sp. NPDC059861]|uniref:hypothetical protein n=1 Tax=Streptomyces sp. NPDC059861 TaxID=3346974 RepID=UPI003651831B